jgi:hypothetical protein
MTWEPAKRQFARPENNRASIELNLRPGHTDPPHTCKACDWRLNVPPRPDLKNPSGPTEGELVDYEWRLRVRGA